LKPVFTFITTAPVELATVAGREEQSGSATLVAALQEGNGLGSGEGEPFPLLDRRCMVAYANDMEGWIRKHHLR
jgi:hypothetical protein